MTKPFFIFAFIFLVVASNWFYSNKPAETKCSASDSTDINPNGSSELSKLMRKMYDHAAGERQLVLAKKMPDVFPQEFLNIHTATPTDSLTKNEHFDKLADMYLLSLTNFNSSAENNLVVNYNNVVSACITCHNEHCPGPIVKIKKLLIAEAVN